ncbi:hypothetical protein CKM354_000122200 [Cercospora kikuchii]|uniref:Uncharacterized protein n=1 Tax=Cercospora kikuchii TaxID=84275 RepID=A0A9P3F818_9PEZI|nr:uncharacterized protein CKM354_000122200 [Cercospora kikuchii]GIZ37786.1 hypothetical protein CKM354_000122200 [Cercospora kikuchii]
MAPDIASLPASPRADRAAPAPPPATTSTTASRRTSQIMGPPQQPASATVHSHHSSRSPVMSTNDGLPMRHPRPLTAAELYLECEKEQEAVVNRLTRELTALRAQSASVASNASSASGVSGNASLLPIDISDPNPTHQMVGATHPTPSRRHRSSSSVSTRSIPTPATTASGTTHYSIHAQSSGVMPIGSVSQAQADRAAAAAGDRSSLSRNPSMSASGTSTPARHSMDVSRAAGALHTLPHRPPLSRDPSHNTASSTHAQAGTPAPVVPQPLPSPAQSPHQASVNTAMQHFADATAYRTEMEIVKAENEALRQRVRALERALRARRRDSSQSETPRLDITGGREHSSRPTEAAAERPSREFNRVPSFTSPLPSAGLGVWDGGVGGVAGPRERSESQSTTASSRRAVGVIDDELRVGESASSVGRNA